MVENGVSTDENRAKIGQANGGSCMKNMLANGAAVLAMLITPAADGQVPRPVFPARPPGVAGAMPGAAAKADTPDEAAVDLPRAVVVPLGPRHIRLHLLDGSVISG